jgi:hypothetical protein
MHVKIGNASLILHFYSLRPHASHFGELPAKKSICLQKKAFACNYFLPAILSKADVKAQ